MNVLNSSKKIIIIGAGITGLTIAKELSEKFGNRVVVLEKENYAGGLAASYNRDDIAFDCGSHRLHIDTRQDICDYINKVTGAPLVKRQRHGRLVYRDKLIHYPPTLFNLLRCFSSKEVISFLGGFLEQRLTASTLAGNDFESTMVRFSGRQFYDAFFKNYAWKLWGVDPSTIAAEAKRKRSFFNYKMLYRSILTGKHYYFYPPGGTGSIAAGLEKKITANGARIIFSAHIKEIILKGGAVASVTMADAGGLPHSLDVSTLISTIPLDDLYGMAVGNLNGHRLRWRGARMVHVLLDSRIDDTCETYYCPESSIRIGRISEINKYSPRLNASLSGACLTFEVPASSDESIWTVADTTLLEYCLEDLLKTKIVKKKPSAIKSFYSRIEKVYPVYLLGWEKTFQHLYDRLNSIENLYTIGRMGLFLHCNIDHCIEQGLAMARHIITCSPTGKKQWHTEIDKFLKFCARD
jgi:protoporphyrinogen oxidase